MIENRLVFDWAIFSLSDLEKTYEREVYSFMQALGDFGGFNDGIVIIPAILMSIYSNKMYLMSLFALLPIKSFDHSKIKHGIKKKFSNDQLPF